VSCPRHAWRYDLATGACLTEPTMPLHAVEVRRDGAVVYVRLRPRLSAESADLAG
jgi:nitrite reductase/ring-hydroxylating ferredoxin subunit